MPACRAASHIGNAVGLTLLLGGSTKYATERHCPLPSTLMDHHGVDAEDFFRLDSESKPMQDVFYDVAGNAAVHLEHARNLRDEVRTTIAQSPSPVLAPHRLGGCLLIEQRCRSRQSSGRSCCQPRWPKVF